MKARLFTALLLLMLGANVASGQRDLILNEVQERLLSLEAETPPFRHFHGLTIQEFLRTRATGAALRDSDLGEAKEEAKSLQRLAEDLTTEAGELSEGLYLAPGVELDASMMYRVSAWEIRRFFVLWSSILSKIQEAEPTSPARSWQFTEELARAEDAYDTARIYRILANQQYLLEGSEDGRTSE